MHSTGSVRSAELNIDLNDHDRSFGTALNIACTSEHSNIVEMFLQNSADLNIDFDGIDCNFRYSCMSGQIKIAKMLMQKSVELNINLKAKDCFNGMSAFHFACEKGNTNIIEMMIENSRLFDFGLFDQDFNGKLGLQIAREHGRIDVINLIKKKLPRQFKDCLFNDLRKRRKKY